jgi:hypothetical protein
MSVLLRLYYFHNLKQIDSFVKGFVPISEKNSSFESLPAPLPPPDTSEIAFPFPHRESSSGSDRPDQKV